MFPYFLKFSRDSNTLTILNITRLRFRVTTFKFAITMAIFTAWLLVLFSAWLGNYFLSNYVPILFFEVLSFSLLKEFCDLELSLLNQFVFDAFFKRTADSLCVLTQNLNKFHCIAREKVEFVAFNNACKKNSLSFFSLVRSFINWYPIRWFCSCLNIV